MQTNKKKFCKYNEGSCGQLGKRKKQTIIIIMVNCKTNPRVNID